MNTDDREGEFNLFLRRFLTEVGRFCKDIYEVSDNYSAINVEHLYIMNNYIRKTLYINYTGSALCIFANRKKLCDIEKLKIICTDFGCLEFNVLDEGVLKMNDGSFLNSLELVKENLIREFDAVGIPRRKFKEIS